MRIFNRFKFAATAAAITLCGTLPVGAESLADAMVSAYRQSAIIEQNRAVLRAADEDAAGAVAELRPALRWIANHNVQRREGDGGSVRSTSVYLEAEIPIYDWGRDQLAIDAAKESVLAARYALVAIEQDILMQATEAYFRVRQAIERVELQKNSLRVIGSERQAAQDRFDVGEITITDVSLADAQLASSRAALADAQGKLEIAKENFEYSTGHQPGNLSAPPPLPKLPESLAAARKIAQATHPTIAQAQRIAAAAEIRVAAAKAERRPELSASLRTGAVRGFEVSEQDYDTRLNTTLGLEMSQTLYSGGRLSAEIRRAMARRDGARADLLNIARRVSEQVGTVWANIDVARAQISAINRQISAAQAAYDGIREEAQLGARTTLDVLDAEQSLLAARADKITADANLQLAHYQLLASMGLLTVESLKLGIPTYDPTEYYNAVRNAPSGSVQGNKLDRVMRALGRGN